MCSSSTLSDAGTKAPLVTCSSIFPGAPPNGKVFPPIVIEPSGHSIVLPGIPSSSCAVIDVVRILGVMDVSLVEVQVKKFKGQAHGAFFCTQPLNLEYKFCSPATVGYKTKCAPK